MYNEQIDYDKNGNIQSLKRNGDFDSNYLGVIVIDDLAYTYDSNLKNQLMNVADGTNNPKGFKDLNVGNADYEYDANGNMIRDDNKNISTIFYNHLNLPTQINFTTGDKIDYLYDATGQKKSKKVTQGGIENVTDYLDGYQYTNEKLNFFPHAEGFVNVSICSECSEGNQQKFNYVYNYTDHFGNIRVSYSLDKIDNGLKILEENHYYPFGLKHTKYNSGNKEYVEPIIGEAVDPSEFGKRIVQVSSLSRIDYKYKYNGKEYQDELGLNFYDYGARNYDPAYGRWINPDALSEEFPDYSPYVYAFNDPVRHTDPDGNAPTDIVIFGANNSSLTIKTNLINVSVNAGSIIGDIGGNYSFSGNDFVVTALDIVGVIDPTPASDLLSASLSADGGDWLGAGASILGAALPYAGDLAKGPKIAKGLDKINDAIKATDKSTDLAKAETRAAKLSQKQRPGMDVTPAGKDATIQLNKAKNNGKTVCETCGTNTIPAKKDTRGVAPPKNRTEIDHVKKKREGGSGTPDNTRVRCRGCNNADR